MAQTWIQVFHCEESWNYKSSLQALCLQKPYAATGIMLALCVPPSPAHIRKVLDFFFFSLKLCTMGAPRSAYMLCIKLGNSWLHVSKYEKCACSLEVFFVFLSVLFFWKYWSQADCKAELLRKQFRAASEMCDSWSLQRLLHYKMCAQPSVKKWCMEDHLLVCLIQLKNMVYKDKEDIHPRSNFFFFFPRQLCIHPADW